MNRNDPQSLCLYPIFAIRARDPIARIKCIRANHPRFSINCFIHIRTHSRTLFTHFLLFFIFLYFLNIERFDFLHVGKRPIEKNPFLSITIIYSLSLLAVNAPLKLQFLFYFQFYFILFFFHSSFHPADLSFFFQTTCFNYSISH